jgi:outer membrane protein
MGHDDPLSTSMDSWAIFRASMNRSSVIILILAASTLAAVAAPRIALIRVRDIYAELPSTAALQERIKNERQVIMKDRRANELRKIISELQAIQTRLSDKKNPLDADTNRKLARSYEIKRQEAQTLQKEFESFRTDQEQEINRRMVADMRLALNQIVATSEKVAKEKGYDLVFDSSGNTNTGVPFILFSKSAPDLTAEVQAELKDLPAQAPVSKSDNTSKQSKR